MEAYGVPATEHQKHLPAGVLAKTPADMLLLYHLIIASLEFHVKAANAPVLAVDTRRCLIGFLWFDLNSTIQKFIGYPLQLRINISLQLYKIRFLKKEIRSGSLNRAVFVAANRHNIGYSVKITCYALDYIKVIYHYTI